MGCSPTTHTEVSMCCVPRSSRHVPDHDVPCCSGSNYYSCACARCVVTNGMHFFSLCQTKDYLV